MFVRGCRRRGEGAVSYAATRPPPPRGGRGGGGRTGVAESAVSCCLATAELAPPCRVYIESGRGGASPYEVNV